MTTLDERALIARLEAADARELAVLLAWPTAEEEKAYRAYLGDERYQRQHDLAVMVGASERGLFSVFGGATPTAPPLGNVVVLPGIMGSELTSVDRAGDTSRIWLNIPRIIAGQIERLRLAADGLSEFNSQFDVRPSGILKAYYGELLLALSRSWNVRAFWYDWRKDLNQVADDLRTKLSQWFGDQPVHLVAHSMGGLVARTFIKRHADRWKSMWDAQTPGVRGGRLIMLGTPNHGAYLIPQAATGLAATVHKLDLVDPWHDRAALLQILNSFVGLFQMLPSPKFDPDAAALYDVKTYGNRGVSSDCLKLALDHHQKVLDEDGDKDRMVYIAGDNQPTLAGIAKGKPIDDEGSYLFTKRGDGSVSHKLGLLTKVPTYYVVSEHSALTAHPQILEALGPLLQGRPVNLSGSPQATRGLEDQEERLPAGSPVAKDYQRRTEADLERVRTLAPRLRSRSLTLVRLTDEAELRAAAQRVRSGLSAEEAAVEARRLRALADRIEAQEALARERIGPEERELADRLARDFVTCPETPTFTAGAGGEEGADALAEPRPSVEIRLMYGSIDKPIEDPIEPNAPLVDAIAAGFYQGTTQPSTTLEALDRAISAVPGKEPSPRRILHDFTDRRILRGELGQPFFLEDPRAPDLHRVV
ncbi:MAG: lipase/acyltransferase domain-containing protein, partial [Planctomycetaceae bacterium]